MPAVQLKKRPNLLWLAMAALAMTTEPAVSGDWKSTYFSSERRDESVLSAEFFSSNPQKRLSFSADRDYGRFVLGGSYSRGKAPGPGLGRSTGAEQFSLRAGYDFGDSLGYVSLGRQHSLGQLGQDESEILGIGVRVSLNRALQLTGEYLHHRKPSETATGLSASRLTIGAAFRF